MKANLTFVILHFQLEVDDPKELSEENVYDEIQPKENVATKKFDKPKGPAGRGPRRMAKTWTKMKDLLYINPFSGAAVDTVDQLLTVVYYIYKERQSEIFISFI